MPEHAPSGRENSRPFTLVLGGGGVPGVAFHAGALRALEDVAGISANDAQAIVGTSAGGLAGAWIRTGCPTSALARRAIGDGVWSGSAPVLTRSWGTPFDLAARAGGASWVLGRSLVRIPFPTPPRPLRRFFRAELAGPHDYSNINSLPHEWPTRTLWLTAVDIVSGRRVVLGRSERSRTISLRAAVQATTAVPGVFAPVRAGTKVLVDGGVHSMNNLDLAAHAHSSHVICIAPLAFDPRSRPPLHRQFLRTGSNLLLQREIRKLRRLGRQAWLILPDAATLEHYRVNFLAAHSLAEIERHAYRQTAARLRTPAGETLCAAITGGKGRKN
ncbi:patatin-like phospholipase family protein [Rhodococcus sp. C26F]